jgi:flagellar basal-body rod modification protein FlgD
LIVTNENGETVYIGDVDKDAGNNITTWNGQKSDGSQAPDGLYTFTIDALDSSDKRIGFSSQAEGRVTGVETQNGQIFLNIGEIPVNLNNIISAAVPQAVA